MTGLMRVDVTEAWSRIKREGLSPTAFVAACVGRAVADHPEVHAYRDWLGRLVLHHRVDIAVLVDVETPTGRFPLAHPLADTDTRSVADLSAELRDIKSAPQTGGAGGLLMRWGNLLGRIPGVSGLFYLLARRSRRLRSLMGTVALSSVGMMAGGSGFVIGTPTVSTLTVLVGAATEQPWVVGEDVSVRRILDVTVQIDHRVVDGAPAARFGARLSELLENPDQLDW